MIEAEISLMFLFLILENISFYGLSFNNLIKLGVRDE